LPQIVVALVVSSKFIGDKEGIAFS